MAYILTLWLFWTAADAVLVQYEGRTCSAALTEVMAVAEGDGITRYRVVSCQMIREA